MKTDEYIELFPKRSDEIFLDNAASTRKPIPVLEAMDAYYRSSCGNIGRGSYRSARAAEAAVEECREKAKHFLGAGESDGIVFTHGATDGLNLLARGFAKSLRPGSNVVTTIAEHHSNLLPWMRACQQRGAQLRIAKPAVHTDDTGNRIVSFRAEDILTLVDSQTALIAITACSNVTGTCLPVGKIVEHSKKLGIPVVVDGAQFAAHQEAEFHSLGCDAMCLSAHKLYGPTGLGILCAKRSFLERLEPDDLGGGIVEDLNLAQGSVRFREDDGRFEAGTLPIAQIVGFSAALTFLQQLGMYHIRMREDKLRKHLLSRMSAIEGIHCIHSGDGAAPLVSVNSDFMSSLDMAAMCDAQRIAVRAGKHCAFPFLDFLGEPATLRVSPCLYNTVEELDIFASLLESLQRRFRK